MIFWQLVLTPQGYVLRPYISIYGGMVEIQLYGREAQRVRLNRRNTSSSVGNAPSDGLES